MYIRVCSRAVISLTRHYLYGMAKSIIAKHESVIILENFVPILGYIGYIGESVMGGSTVI